MNNPTVARENMILGQIMPNKVIAPEILEAISSVPRELFVPDNLKGVAYADDDLEIAPGRYLIEPMILARLLLLAEVHPTDNVLDIGPATGYTSAVLSRLCKRVTALESDIKLAEQSRSNLSELGVNNASITIGNLSHGYPASAPYNVIFIGGSIQSIPSEITSQLAENGRMVAILDKDGVGNALIVRKLYGNIMERLDFDAMIMPMPGFEKTKKFQF